MLLDMGAWKPNGNDPVGSMKSLQKWLVSLTDGINDCLCSIDAGNLDDAFYATLKATKVVAETVISNTIITQEMYSLYGSVANLAVYKLRTDYEKAQKYLDSDTSDVNYISIHDETISFITAKVGEGTAQLTDGDLKFYWTDDTRTQMTSDKTTDYPVTIYSYTELVKLSVFFYQITEGDLTYYAPAIRWGAGTDGNANYDVCVMYKKAGAFIAEYTTSAGKKVRWKISDYVDADMRRIKSAAINKSAGTIAVTMEGESSATTLNYTETATSMTFTWPDGHAATISIN